LREYLGGIDGELLSSERVYVRHNFASPEDVFNLRGVDFIPDWLPSTFEAGGGAGGGKRLKWRTAMERQRLEDCISYYNVALQSAKSTIVLERMQTKEAQKYVEKYQQDMNYLRTELSRANDRYDRLEKHYDQLERRCEELEKRVLGLWDENRNLSQMFVESRNENRLLRDQNMNLVERMAVLEERVDRMDTGE
jgi:chromosome segregation ATPase